MVTKHELRGLNFEYTWPISISHNSTAKSLWRMAVDKSAITRLAGVKIQNLYPWKFCYITNYIERCKNLENHKSLPLIENCLTNKLSEVIIISRMSHMISAKSCCEYTRYTLNLSKKEIPRKANVLKEVINVGIRFHKGPASISIRK